MGSSIVSGSKATILWVIGFLGLLAAVLAVIYAVRRFWRKQEDFLWAQRPMDVKARAANDCRILRTVPDSGYDSLTNAYIEIVSPTCENGLPHTTDANTIRMTEDVWNGETREDILRHERLHLMQKRAPQRWEDFYLRSWNYTLHSRPPPGLEEQVQLIRGNPDTAEKPWACWGNRYWFIPLYASIQKPTLLGAPVHVWDANQKEWLREPPLKWRNYFCGDGKCPFQWEHPHEISAEIWTKSEFSTDAAVSLEKFIRSIN